MTESAGRATARSRRRRADAEVNKGAVLDAAVEVLNADPGASVEAIATAAGVSRQTVYANYSSRESLLAAVIEHATATVTTALDAAGLDDVPPAVALTRLLDASWQAAARYSFLWHLPPVDPAADADRHSPVLSRMRAIIQRGQETGDFDAAVSADWLLSAALALGRAAEDEVRTGRMSIDQATRSLQHSYLGLFGIGPGR